MMRVTDVSDDSEMAMIVTAMIVTGLLLSMATTCQPLIKK